jgi:carbamoyltransferase
MEPCADPEREVAGLLAAGQTVARFAGRMEWGPRALGNRSILHRPDDPAVNDWLNARLRRTEFMPFAPAVLAERAPALFEDYSPLADAARFMTAAFRCTPTFARQAPGVVHRDGTARPQVVHREDLPDFHRLLGHFERLTGLPGVLNTSFNLHEEPIVCTPEDALRAWDETRIDVLQLGRYLVRRSPEPRASG